ncbi:hypothetical protein Tco_1419184 [Tanacetum coccineum]
MASHSSNSRYAIKECLTCGSLYTRECCSIGSLENKIFVPEPDTSPCCVKCGTPVDGPYCHGCAFLRKKFEEYLLTYCIENGIYQDFQDTFESSDDNTNVINALREPMGYCGGPHFDYQCQPINETYYEPNPSYDSSGFDQPQPPQDFVDSHGILQALNKMQEELEEIKQDRRKKKEDMSIEEMRHEQQLVDYKIKDITNDLGYKRFRGEKIDEEYERDCEIRIQKLKQDFNEWGSEVQKKEQAYEEEKYSAARRRMLSIPFVDEDDYIPLGDIIARYSTSKAITPDLPIEEPNNSLSMGDEHLNTTSSIENLVPIPIDNNRVNVEIDFVESLIDRDTSIVYSSKIDPILEEFAGELAHIAPIPPGIVEADFDPNDDTSSDDDSFENIEYVDASPSYIEYDSFEEVNDVEQEEKEFDLEDIFQIQDVILREKLLNFESFHFDPSFPRPPPEPPDVEICLHFEPDAPVIDNFNELNDDQRGSEIDFSQNVEMTIITLSLDLFIRFILPLVLLYLAPPGVKIRSLTPASSLRAGGISFASPRTN